MRSIAASLRRLVYLGWAMLLAVSLTAVLAMRIQAGTVDYLTSVITPAVNINTEIFRYMTSAQAELREYQISRDEELLTLARAARVHIMAALATLDDRLMVLTDHNVADRTFHAELGSSQRVSVEQWWSYALSTKQVLARASGIDSSQGVALFDNFRRANTTLDGHLEIEINQSQSAARSASHTGLTVIITGALVALAAAIVLGRRLARSVSQPIIDLQDTMIRHHGGDLGARARENLGSREIRSLAHDFNAFIEHEFDLRQIQAHALCMHEVTIKIEHAMRAVSNTQQSLEIMCAALGEGLGVDRVMVNTMYVDHEAPLRAQWHLPGLPPVRDLPDEIIPHIFSLGNELWRSSRLLVSYDRPAPEAQSERARVFYRHSGARATIVAPIGLGDRIIGMIYVVTVHGSRQWTDSEIDAVQRVAAFLGRVVVEETYRTQQSQYVERLEQLERQRTNFVATVSHELRTPLTSIAGYLELLKDGYTGELTAEQQRMLKVMDRNTNRLSRLIEELLTPNSSERVKLNIGVAGVPLGEMITSIGEQMSSFAQSHDVKLVIDTGPRAAIIRGDEEQLRNAFINIVSNAIKFSRPGGAVKITCTLDENTQLVRFTCQDSGIGIPLADQQRLFTRFFRASNTTDQAIPGIGLGLTFVKQIVEDHGGEVHVTSFEGKGTTVIVDLPWYTPASS
ncbi:MAG: sensor histidine kinase [Ilumatobacteraceae bacterium]